MAPIPDVTIHRVDLKSIFIGHEPVINGDAYRNPMYDVASFAFSVCLS